jgi:hypothetical protein
VAQHASRTRTVRSTGHRTRHAGTALAGPASLASPGARSLTSCHLCGGQHVTAIGMTLTDGSQVKFASCHRCENRWWVEGGSELSFEHVIAKARKIA